VTEDSTVARGVLVSTSSQLAAKVLHLALNVISTLAIVRYLGPDAYGSYILVLTLTLLVGLFADFGLPQLAVREVSGGVAGEQEIVGTVAVMRLALAVVSMAIPQLVLLAMHQPAEVHLAAAVASLLYLGDAILASVLVVFHVRIKQQYEALVRISMEILETALVLILIAAGASLPWLFAPPVIGAALGAGLAFALATKRFQLRMRFDRHLVRRLVVEAIPIGPALLIGVLYLKLDAVVLAAMRPPRDVGLYGSANQPIEYFFLASAVLINVIFPLLATAHGRLDHDRFVALYRRGTEVLVVVTLIVPVMLLFIASPMVALVYGPAYADAAGPLQILAVALVLMTVNAWQSLVLLSGGLQRVTLRYNIIALVIALVLCVGCVAALGMMGAALATLGTAVYVLYASTSAVRKGLQARLDPFRLVRIMIAAALTAGVLLGLDALGVPWPVLGVAAVLTYVAVLLRLGVHKTFKEALT
jgi:O-antigen/teichoic acid export membrane protein